MSDRKAYCIFLGILGAVIILFKFSPTIFPFMDDDDYFVDKHGYIHGKSCPYKKVPWFTKKNNKYDILIKQDQEICRECLLLEEDKLLELHYINLKLKEAYLMLSNAPEDYIKKTIKQYK